MTPRHDSRDTFGELALVSSLLALYVGLRGTARALGAAQALASRTRTVRTSPAT